MQLLKIGVDVSFFKKQDHQIKYAAVVFLHVGKGISDYHIPEPVIDFSTALCITIQRPCMHEYKANSDETLCYVGYATADSPQAAPPLASGYAMF